jgi:formylmethanofuran dehydrogenase subunit A
MDSFFIWVMNNPRKYIVTCVAIGGTIRWFWAGGNISHWLNPLWPWFV